MNQTQFNTFRWICIIYFTLTIGYDLYIDRYFFDSFFAAPFFKYSLLLYLIEVLYLPVALSLFIAEKRAGWYLLGFFLLSHLLSGAAIALQAFFSKGSYEVRHGAGILFSHPYLIPFPYGAFFELLILIGFTRKVVMKTYGVKTRRMRVFITIFCLLLLIMAIALNLLTLKAHSELNLG